MWDCTQLHLANGALTQFGCDLLVTYGRLRQIDTLLVSMFNVAAEESTKCGNAQTPISFTPQVQCTWAQCFQGLPDGQVALIWECFLAEIMTETNADTEGSLDKEPRFVWHRAYALAADVFCVFLNHVVVTMQNCSVHEAKLEELKTKVLQPLGALEEAQFALDVQMLKSCLSLTLAFNELVLVVWRMYGQFLSKPLVLQQPKCIDSVALLGRSKTKAGLSDAAQIQFWNYQSDIQKLCFSSAQLSAELQGETREVATTAHVPVLFEESVSASQNHLDILIDTAVAVLQRSRYTGAAWSGHALDIADEKTLGVAVWHHFARVFPPFERMCTPKQLVKVATCIIGTFASAEHSKGASPTNAVQLQATSRALLNSPFFSELGQLQTTLVQMAMSAALARVNRRILKVSPGSPVAAELQVYAQQFDVQCPMAPRMLGDVDVDVAGLLGVLAIIKPGMLPVGVLNTLLPAIMLVDYALNDIRNHYGAQKTKGKDSSRLDAAALAQRISACRQIVWQISSAFPQCIVGTLLSSTQCTLHRYVQSFLALQTPTAKVAGKAEADAMRQIARRTTSLVRVFFQQASLLQNAAWDTTMVSEVRLFVDGVTKELTVEDFTRAHKRPAFVSSMHIATAVFEGMYQGRSRARSATTPELATTLEMMMQPLADCVRNCMEGAGESGAHSTAILHACVVLTQTAVAWPAVDSDFVQGLIVTVCTTLVAATACADTAGMHDAVAQVTQCLQHLDAMIASICNAGPNIFCRTVAALLHAFAAGIAGQVASVVDACASIFGKMNNVVTAEQRSYLFAFMDADLKRASQKLFCLNAGATSEHRMSCANRIEAVLKVWETMQRSQAHQAVKRSFYHDQLANLTEIVHPLVQYLQGIGQDLQQKPLYSRIQHVCNAGLSAIQATLDNLNSGTTGLSGRAMSALLLVIGCDTHLETIITNHLSLGGGGSGSGSSGGSDRGTGAELVWHKAFDTKYNILEGLVRVHSKGAMACISLFSAAIRPLMVALLLLDRARVLQDNPATAEEACRCVARLHVQFAALAGAGKHAMHTIAVRMPNWRTANGSCLPSA